MRLIPLLVSALLLAAPAMAKAPYVAKAKKAGFDKITSCKSCHEAAMPKDKGEPFGEIGKWLIKEKATRKAAEVDVAWLKDYYAKHK